MVEEKLTQEQEAERSLLQPQHIIKMDQKQSEVPPSPLTCSLQQGLTSQTSQTALLTDDQELKSGTFLIWTTTKAVAIYRTSIKGW